MISRFFVSRQLRRCLCFFLAFLTLAFALSPALFQPAEAVAVADDITLALGLLFTSWAGITFATNAGAQTAVSNLISSKPNVASSIAGLITKNLVTEGSKLLLTGDVKTGLKKSPGESNLFRTLLILRSQLMTAPVIRKFRSGLLGRRRTLSQMPLLILPIRTPAYPQRR